MRRRNEGIESESISTIYRRDDTVPNIYTMRSETSIQEQAQQPCTVVSMDQERDDLVQETGNDDGESREARRTGPDRTGIFVLQKLPWNSTSHPARSGPALTVEIPAVPCPPIKGCHDRSSLERRMGMALLLCFHSFWYAPCIVEIHLAAAKRSTSLATRVRRA